MAKREHLPPFDPNSENPQKRVPSPTVVMNKPLSYESLKNVLQFMDPNKRFEVATTMPSIRPTNRIIPLKIERLIFGEMLMIVNRTKYQLGVYREHHDRSRKIKAIKEDNDRGGVPYDVDLHGLRDISADAVTTPGDIRFEEPEEPRKLTMKDYQNWLNTLKSRYEFRTPDESLDHPSEGHTEMFLLERILKNKLPPFNNFLQLTINKTWDDKPIQRVPYTFKLREAFKNLTTNFFGDTSKVVQVKKLKLDRSPTTFDMSVIRLPTGLQLKVDEIHLHRNIPRALDKLPPILHPSTFPLRCLRINSDDVPEYQHPIIQNNVKKLVINYVHWNFIPILKFHKNIHLLCWNLPEFDGLIRHWIDIQREIGSSILVDFVSEHMALEVWKKIKEQDFDFRIQEARKITISVNRISEIRLKMEEPDHTAYEREKRWSIQMEMVAV